MDIFVRMLTITLIIAVAAAAPLPWDTPVGEVFALLLEQLEAQPGIALHWAAHAASLGIFTCQDVAEHMGETVAEATASELFSNLNTFSVPAAAVVTFAAVLLKLVQQTRKRLLASSDAAAVVDADADQNAQAGAAAGAAASQSSAAAHTVSRPTRDTVLPEQYADLRIVQAMLQRTYDQMVRGQELHVRGVQGYKGHWKNRFITHTFWNQCQPSHLRQLEACAAILAAANGAFVPMSTLFKAAYVIDSEPAHVRTRQAQFYSDRFRPWLVRYLAPAIQYYVHRRGVARREQSRVYFYMCPVGAASAANLKDSFHALLSDAEERSVETRLAVLRVPEYLRLMPDHATQRVLRSMLLELSGSASFLAKSHGLKGTSLELANECVNLAMATSIALERDAPDFVDAKEGRVYLRDVREKVAAKLADAHGGGLPALSEVCAAAGQSLTKLIEDGKDELSQFSYEECAAAVATEQELLACAPVGPRRDGGREKGERSGNCSWENLAALVTLKMKIFVPNFEISDAAVRTYCYARRIRSLEGARHATGAACADVGCRRIQSANEEWNIDHTFANATVAYYETRLFQLLAAGINAMYVKWDDHSKIESDKKRGWASCRTLIRRSKVRSAPYSDMGKGVTLGGCKVVANSMLVLAPMGTDPDDARFGQAKRGTSYYSVLKRAFGVTRLDNERRSTPTQQFNDLRYLLSQVPWLGRYFTERCAVAFWLSDAGWDHSPRNDEVQLAHVRCHLEHDRDYDAAFVRAKGASSRNEAERVNAEFTQSLSVGESASATPFGKPTSADELQKNQRGFLFAVSDLLRRAAYAGSRVKVFASYPGCTASATDSAHCPEEEREALRAVAAAAPSKRAGMPRYAQWANHDRYRELHGAMRHYAFEVQRHSCWRMLGRLCTAADYPCPDALTFKPCCERPLRLPERWHGDLLKVPDPELDPARGVGKYKASAEMDEIADRWRVAMPPSRVLKVFAAEHSLSPSPAEIKELAKKALGSEEAAEDVERYMSDKRAMRYLKAEEQRKALVDPSSTQYLLHVVLRILHAASDKVKGLSAPFKKPEFKLLLGDKRVKHSTLGTKKELAERIFEQREHIMSILQLDRAQIMRVPTADELAADADDDALSCLICQSDVGTDDNPIIKCDGDHLTEVGYHLNCLPEPLGKVPDGAWYCQTCRDSGLFPVEAVLDKRQRAGRTEYKLRWEGWSEEHDSWEPWPTIPTLSRPMINEFNAKRRTARAAVATEATAADGVTSSGKGGASASGKGKGGGKGNGGKGNGGKAKGGRGRRGRSGRGRGRGQ